MYVLVRVAPNEEETPQLTKELMYEMPREILLFYFQQLQYDYTVQQNRLYLRN